MIYNIFNICANIYTVCLRSLDPFYKGTYKIKDFLDKEYGQL